MSSGLFTKVCLFPKSTLHPLYTYLTDLFFFLAAAFLWPNAFPLLSFPMLCTLTHIPIHYAYTGDPRKFLLASRAYKTTILSAAAICDSWLYLKLSSGGECEVGAESHHTRIWSSAELPEPNLSLFYVPARFAWISYLFCLPVATCLAKVGCFLPLLLWASWEVWSILFPPCCAPRYEG